MFEDDQIPVGGEEQPSSLDRATEYMKEHPANAPEPTPEIPPKKEEAAPAAGSAQEKDPAAAAPKEQTPEEKAAAEAKAKEQAPPAIDEKVILEHPKYKEAQGTIEGQKAILDELKPILQNDRYAITDANNLKAVLDDAFVLYDIASGKGKVADLLNLFEKNWDPAAFKAVMLDLKDFLNSKDIKTEGLDPRNEKDRAVLELQRQNTERQTAAAQEKIEKTRQDAVATLQTSVKTLAEKAGVQADDIHDYALVISAKIGADPKFIKLLEQGKANAEIERLFTEHHNRELARQKRWLDAKVAGKEKREETLPRVPVREAGPAPKPGDKPYAKRSDLQTSEGRLAAAKKQWDATGT